MNTIQNPEVNQNEPNNDSGLTVDIQGIEHWGIPDRKTRKQWYQSTNPQIRSYITGNASTSISGKGARSLQRAADEYQYLSEDFSKNQYSSQAMSRKYDRFNGIDLELIDLARRNADSTFNSQKALYESGQLSQRKFNRAAKKYERALTNLDSNYRTLYEVWHNKHGIPLTRTQSSVSPAPFVLGSVGMPLAIIGGLTGGVAAAPYIAKAAPFIGKVLSNPLVQGYFTYNSINNLVSDRGVKKTINHFKNDEIGNGLLSAAGDLSDIAAVGFGASSIYKAGKKSINMGIQQAREIQAAEAALFNNRPQITQTAPIHKQSYLTWEAELARQNPRIAKIDAAEHGGVPKMDRFNIRASRTRHRQRSYDPTLPTPENPMSSDVFSQNLHSQLSNIRYAKDSEQYANAVSQYLNNFSPVVNDSRSLADAPESVRAMKAFTATLPENINPKFGNVTSELTGNIESYYITEYRRYLQREGIDTSYFTTSDLQKLLTHSANHLDSQVTGKLKGIELWHSTSRNFDQFKHQIYLGSNTGNNGVWGPGNYFTAHLPFPYGWRYMTHPNAQPFYVSNIKGVVPGTIAQQKKLVSKPFEEPMTRLKGSQVVIGRNTGGRSQYEAMSNKYPAEIVVFKDTGIKSLYPHPSRYFFNEDGTVAFTPTNWNDARFNYKTGGTIPNPYLTTNNQASKVTGT